MGCGVNKLIFGITGTEEPIFLKSASLIFGTFTIAVVGQKLFSRNKNPFLAPKIIIPPATPKPSTLKLSPQTQPETSSTDATQVQNTLQKT
jgi:hypothetical protein